MPLPNQQRVRQDPEEREKNLADLEMFEPKMRRATTREIDTSKPFDRVVNEIVGLVAQPSA